MEFQEATAQRDAQALVPEVEISGEGYAVGTVFAKIGGHKVRAEVRAGCPPMLSWGKVYVWSPLGLTWNLIYTLPKMKTPWFRGGHDVENGMFSEDLSELVSAARAILM